MFLITTELMHMYRLSCYIWTTRASVSPGYPNTSKQCTYVVYIRFHILFSSISIEHDNDWLLKMHFTIFTLMGHCLRGCGKFIGKFYMLPVVNNESGSGERDILNRAVNLQAPVFNDCTVTLKNNWSVCCINCLSILVLHACVIKILDEQRFSSEIETQLQSERVHLF